MRVPVGVLVGLVAVVLLAGCSSNVFELSAGTCFDDPGSGEISDVPIVECDDPHDNEVYATFDLPDGDYPGDEQVAAQADAGCEGRFADWAGISYEESRLVYSHLSPTADGWDRLDDREVVCFVFDISGDQLTGTMQSASY